MPIDRPESRKTVAPLSQRVAAGAPSAEIAATMATICVEIGRALSPIVGARGVTALHMRSLHLCAAQQPWMAGLRQDRGGVVPTPATGWDALVAMLAEREPAEAHSVGDAYLQIFFDLLVSLIGPSLTDRLLRTIWTPTTSGPPAQDISR